MIAAVVAVFISAVPGSASAEAPQVVPLINCYYPHSDGSLTVVLGYRSTYSTTQTIQLGSRNRATPDSYSNSLPTTFEPGPNNGVATLRIAAAHLNSGNAWRLDGTVLDYEAAITTAGPCTQAQLPAFANGATITVLLLLAGLAGVLVVRRISRMALRAGSPDRTTAPGGDHA